MSLDFLVVVVDFVAVLAAASVVAVVGRRGLHPPVGGRLQQL